MKAQATQQHGYSPRLMRAATVLRMGAASFAEFLRHHDNPCVVASALPPPPPPVADDIRDELRQRRLEMPPPAALSELLDGLIECVEDDGALDVPDSWREAIPAARLRAAIDHLRLIAPPGVGWRDQRERLLSQINATPPSAARDAAARLVADSLPWLARKRRDKLPKKLLAAAAPLLNSLPAPPGAGAARPPAPAIPDVAYVWQRGLWRAIAAAGLNIAVSARRADGATATQWAEARALVGAARARRQWALKIAQLAADRQSDYFSDGAAALRPFSLRQAAAELGVSPGFASHLVNDKIAIFGGGVFPLKSLFARRGGGNACAATRALIKAMLNDENARRPLTDSALCRLLRRRGVAIARRTVSKHRQLAGFPAAARRKQFPVGGAAIPPARVEAQGATHAD